MKKIDDAFEGRVVHGRVEWKGGKPPPDGSRVQARAKRPRLGVERSNGGKSRKLPASRDIWELLKGIEGMAKGLPADLGPNLDHYLYGTPKR